VELADAQLSQLHVSVSEPVQSAQSFLIGFTAAGGDLSPLAGSLRVNPAVPESTPPARTDLTLTLDHERGADVLSTLAEKFLAAIAEAAERRSYDA
jgi:hypothetical protein